MIHDNLQVVWTIQAQRDLNEQLRSRIDGELISMYRELATDNIIVKQRLDGYSSEPESKLILAIEVRLNDRAHSNVIKIGDRSEVAGDYEGWRSCTYERGTTSRMFMAPELHLLSDQRAVIVYPDAYQYFYDEKDESAPRELESIVRNSIRSNIPSSTSVERVLTQVFTEAYRCFYRFASECNDPQQIVTWIAESLQYSNRQRQRRSPVMDRWNESDFRDLRRDAVWLTCGSRKPESIDPPEYLDPVDYLDWAMSQGQIPAMLIGPSHGDLHGRNIIVGVVRGEAEWPAVFDFDKMRESNLVAWDFAKLEMELKCRLFQHLLESTESLGEIQRALDIAARRPLPDSIKQTPEELNVLHRSVRMECMFEIEKTLGFWTRQFTTPGKAYRSDTAFDEQFPSDTELGRALRIILRIRREAAVYLGFQRQGRETRWRDEYYFALLAYGVVSAKWHSADDHIAWALLSAGTAAAKLPQFPWPPDPSIEPNLGDMASYLQLLPYSDTCWKDKQWEQAVQIMDKGVKRFPYAVPLEQQRALVLAESDDWAEEERGSREIRKLAQLACVFRDHETLCRLGRIHKDRGDREWNGETHQQMVQDGLPAYQEYLAAYEYYQLAFDISQDYYPGVNAACLAMLTGNRDAQRELAQQVLEICHQLPTNSPDQTWILASEGEASLLVNKPEDAVRFYESCVRRILPKESGVIQSMYSQLCRMQWALGKDQVGPVIEMLDREGRLAQVEADPFTNIA